MAHQSVEFVCTSCGLSEELAIDPARMRAVICEGCGGRMMLAMDEADEADRSFAESADLVHA